MLERIRQLCKEKGLTFAGLEKALGFANASIAKTNEKTQICRLKQIADYFNVSIDYLVYGSETPNNGLSAEERTIIALFQKLNAQGKKEAIKRITELAKLAEYTENRKKSSESKVG